MSDSISSWVQFGTAAFVGGVIVKLLDWLQAELHRSSKAAAKAKVVVEDELDPLLKAAGSLGGKLRSLAVEDFVELAKFRQPTVGKAGNDETDFANLLYLFGRFWAQIEILEIQSRYVRLAKNATGSRLLKFLNCLEARSVRLVERGWQRAFGGILLERRGEQVECMSFAEFLRRYRTEPGWCEWFEPLTQVLRTVGERSKRQRLLLYGVVLHALVDDLDPSHEIVHDRPPYPNKLSKRIRRDLRYKVFPVYLPFVAGHRKYWHVAAE